MWRLLFRLQKTMLRWNMLSYLSEQVSSLFESAANMPWLVCPVSGGRGKLCHRDMMFYIQLKNICVSVKMKFSVFCPFLQLWEAQKVKQVRQYMHVEVKWVFVSTNDWTRFIYHTAGYYSPRHRAEDFHAVSHVRYGHILLWLIVVQFPVQM